MWLGHCKLKLSHYSSQGQAMYVDAPHMSSVDISEMNANHDLVIVEEAATIKNVDIASELCLPPVKREFYSFL
jgi:hypothetical protein